MKQSKLESSLEATVNIASGFVISLLVWQFFVAPLINAGFIDVGHVSDSLLITSIFTVSSWLRSYIWRRFFNAGMHKFIHAKVGEWYAR